MKVIIYLYINICSLIIFGIGIYKGLKDEKSIVILLLAAAIIVIAINLILFIFDKGLGKLIDLIFKSYEKRKMKNYNLFEWMGEPNWIKLYDNLSEIKKFDKSSIQENFERIKMEIKKEFNSIEKMEYLKVLLEVKVESSRITNLNTISQTILVALITTSLVSFINGVKSNDFYGILYLIIVLIVWFILLGAISFFSKRIDKYRLLLKLVTKCIDEEKSNDNVGNINAKRKNRRKVNYN